MMMNDATRKSCFVLLLGLVIYSFLFFTRIYWYTPWCAVNPSPCTIDHVNAFDRIVFQFNSVQADFWSNVVQNFVGLFVFTIPWFLFSRPVALSEILLTGKTAIWNLAWIELVRSIIQRPRPLVFNSVFGDGANIHQYTSFYSGHTSFVTLACFSFYYLLKRRFPLLSSRSKILILLICFSLSTLTGSLRVLGGRHYPSDVIVGLLMGILLNYYFQKKIDTSPQFN